MRKLIALFGMALAAVSAQAQVANGPRFGSDGSIHAPTSTYSINGSTGGASFNSIAATSATLATPLPVSSGGTGSTSAAGVNNSLQYIQGDSGSVSRSNTAKFKDRIDAKDFGVKCDGATDDTAALNQLFTVEAGKQIILPSGTCLYNGGGVSKSITGNIGVNPFLGTPTVGSSPYTFGNTLGESVQVYVSGGTVSSITVDGTSVASTSNVSFVLPAGSAMTITYSSAPTIRFKGI